VTAEKSKEKYIAPYFCFVQSSGMGNTKLCMSLSNITSEEFSSDLILSGDILLEKADPNKSVCDHKLYLRRFLTNPDREASEVAKEMYNHLDEKVITDLTDMMKTHVFLSDEAQGLSPNAL
jgi:hypothetical protein